MAKKTENKKCPACGEFYQGVGALSRKDNGTEICSKCGQAEGMEELMNYFFSLMEK